MVCLCYRSYFHLSSHITLAFFFVCCDLTRLILTISRSLEFAFSNDNAAVCAALRNDCFLICLFDYRLTSEKLLTFSSSASFVLESKERQWSMPQRGFSPSLSCKPSLFYSTPVYSNLFPISHFSGENCILKELQAKMYLGFCHNKRERFLPVLSLFCLQSLGFGVHFLPVLPCALRRKAGPYFESF